MSQAAGALVQTPRERARDERGADIRPEAAGKVVDPPSSAPGARGEAGGPEDATCAVRAGMHHVVGSGGGAPASHQVTGFESELVCLPCDLMFAMAVFLPRRSQARLFHLLLVPKP